MMKQVSHRFSYVLFAAALGLVAACKRAETTKPPVVSSATLHATQAPTSDPSGSAVAAPVEISRPQEPEIDWRALLEQQGPPSLITLKEVNEQRCEWSVLRPPELEERAFLITHGCPKDVVWDRRGGRSLFELEGVLYLHDWQSARIETVKMPPLRNAYYGFATTGAILACENTERSDGHGHTVSYRTTLLQQEDGTWKQLGYEQSGDEIPDIPCVGLLAGAPGGLRYEPRYQNTHACPPDATKDMPCPSQQVVEELIPRLTGVHDVIYYAAFSEHSFVTFPVKLGYDETILSPVFSVEGTTLSPIYDRRPVSTPVDVLFSPDYFLVRAHTEMTHATLFKKGQVGPVKEFPDSTVVAWIPGTITAALIELTPKDAATKSN